jgi:hypothetical protein
LLKIHRLLSRVENPRPVRPSLAVGISGTIIPCCCRPRPLPLCQPIFCNILKPTLSSGTGSILELVNDCCDDDDDVNTRCLFDVGCSISRVAGGGELPTNSRRVADRST